MSITTERKRLARTAASIHALLTADPSAAVRFEPPDYWWQRVKDDLQHLTQAQQRGWNAGLETQRRAALSSVRQLAGVLAVQQSRLEQLSPPLVVKLSARDVYEDLLALHEEFQDRVEWNAKGHTLSVETESIELDGHYLGPFRIELQLTELCESLPYSITALDPHPAARNDAVVHPHVNDGVLCEGDGKAPIRAALQGGRLLDFFQLVNNILHTYNPEGPYVALDSWEGACCADCDYTIEGESYYTCSQCHCTICSECERSCGVCSESLCNECRTGCARCDESLCGSCARDCTSCTNCCCPDCLQNERCQNCHEEENQSEESSAAAGAGATV